jgi:pimeloyl-ACP methyl ester carboxylesterase
MQDFSWLNPFRRAQPPIEEPRLIPIRNRSQSRAAIVFLHGFGGAAEATWGRFPELLAADPALASWDVYSLGYPTTLRIDVPLVWAADPPLHRLAISLQTALGVAPLAQYQTVAVIAHSMGGLVAQRALLYRDVALKVGHLLLFGTPSRGLYKSLIGLPVKRQTRDMFAWSPFILDLRVRWWWRYRKHRPFKLQVIAGERDEFVPPRSSLAPFPSDVQRVVPGNHLGIVKPSVSLDRSVQVVIQALTGTTRAPSLVDSALLALEQREFARVIADLGTQVPELDDIALVALALALEESGRSQEALHILEQHYQDGTASTEALGVLAGRIKRRWLAGRKQADWARARRLYSQALSQADPAGMEPIAQVVDPDQAMYHAINVAFLDLMATPNASAVPDSARVKAERARAHAASAVQNHWRWAVEGDALAMLGDLDSACRAYSTARASASSPREIDSMYSQAVRIAARIYGTSGVTRVEQSFRIAGGSQRLEAAQPPT